MRSFFIGLVTAVCICSSLAAQDRMPKKFYNNGYAATPGKPEYSNDEPKAKSKLKSIEEKQVESSADQIEKEVKRTESSVLREIEGAKVIRIGAILSSDDTDEFLRHGEELVEIGAKYDIDLGAVIQIGPELESRAKRSRDFLTKLWILDGQVVPLEKVPPKYSSVRFSPTFIIELENGEVILEAPHSLKEHFTAKGQFVEKGQNLTSTAKEVEDKL